VGIGSTPATALAEISGLETLNGVRVDARLATSDPDIYAAGDCCSFPHPLYGGRRMRLESWRAAQQQGTIAAHNMLGAEETFEAVPWSWSDQFDVTLYVVGLYDMAESEVARDLTEGVTIRFGLASDGRIVSACGVGPGNAAARQVRLAEMLISRRAQPGRGELADPSLDLKALVGR
jgi:3-phenylpropionate/trans-cinnamate dioxygenase ferredoxin reductase subunit